MGCQGGAVGSTATISFSTFFENAAGQYSGGAIYLGFGGTMAIKHSAFIENSVNQGGAIYAFSSLEATSGSEARTTVTISLSQFEGNRATKGGGIYAGPGSLISISRSSFDSNTAETTFTAGVTPGAHLYFDAAEPKISETTFQPFSSSGGESVFLAALAGCEQYPCPLGHSCTYRNYSLSCEPCSTTTVGLEFDDSGGSIACTSCQPGQEPNEDSTACVPCSSSTQSKTGVECVRCPSGQYRADSQTCTKCPLNMQTNSMGDGCSCADGYYDASFGPLVCYSVGSDFFVDDFTGRNVVEQPECPRCPSACQPCDGRLQHCVSCTNGIATLKEGTAISEADKANAKTTGMALTNNGIVGPLAMFECPSNGCLGQNTTNGDTRTDDTPEWLSPCRVGYLGPLCSACDTNGNYIKDGADCALCSETAGPSYYLWMLAAIVLATTSSCMFLKFGTAGTDAVEDVVSLQQSVSVVQGKILIGVLQITAELPSVLRLNYPVGFNKLLVAARVLLVDLFSTFKLDCVSPLSLHARFVIVVLLPPAGIAIVQLLRLWNDYKSAEHKLANSNKAAYRSAFIIVLLYPLLCRTCFRMFACQKLGEEEGWHPDDFTIACDSSVHTFFKVMASVGVIVYPIGIPLVFMVLLQYDKR
eukprot:COSAG02_NODE_7238_length_3103_cov_1.651899_1_plen_644_part_10